MRNYFYSTVFALALITAYAVSQTGSYPPSNQPSNQPQSGTTSPPDASQSTSPSSNQNGQSQTMPQADKTPPVDDQTLQSQVRDQLASNPAFSGINVTANKGVVTLEGTVASKEDRQQAKKMAQSVAGVKSVKDKLTVASSTTTPAPTSRWMSLQSSSSNGTTQPSSSSSGSATQESKGSSAGQSSSQTGTYPSTSGSQSSGQTGSSTSQSSSGMPQSGASASTADSSTLQNQIQNALKNEPTLAADSITVSVTDSAVELSGTAATKKDKQTAKRIAQSYAGNRKVKDDITVSGSESNTMPQSDQTTPRPDKDKSKQNPPDQTVPHL